MAQVFNLCEKEQVTNLFQQKGEMDPIVVSGFPFDIDVAALLASLRLDVDSEHADIVRDMVRSAKAIAHPKALCGVAYVQSRSDDGVVIDGVSFHSRVLAVNLQDAHRVFPYVATCGREADAWSEAISDVFFRYLADAIKQALLASAFLAVRSFIDRHFQPGKTARMNPGSLADWPTSQQQPLFQLAGDPKSLIGVELTESFMMVPTKSVSGLLFPTETSFENCQLCPRDPCPGRRAPYDEDLYARKFAKR